MTNHPAELKLLVSNTACHIMPLESSGLPSDFGMSKKVKTEANQRSNEVEELLKSQGLETAVNGSGGTPFWMAVSG